MTKKVLVLLTDGVGIRNFVQTEFSNSIINNNINAVWWNMSGLPLDDVKPNEEIKLESAIVHKLTPIYTRARKRLELNSWLEKFQDPVYNSYKFPFNYKSLKNTFRSIYTQFLISQYSRKSGIERIIQKIEDLERSTDFYRRCLEQLKKERPDVVFCTTQRSTKAIAPLLAAKDLGIRTISFIYSWDNVPKAMLLTEADFYFVWSDLMKSQMLKYYDWLDAGRIKVTGTPQFEPHYCHNKILDRKDFFDKYNLDPDKKYICYSGDDVTTSPLDELYLRDLAMAIKNLNINGWNLGIIFRRAPVDTSRRYDKVLQQFPEIIESIDPLWQPYGEQWNLLLPKMEDFYLLSNICEHSELVVNICSSMVFDFAIHNKPCIYINYEQPALKKGIRDIGQNYKYVHFRSMPSKKAVSWVKNSDEFKKQIEDILNNNFQPQEEVLKWFEIVAGKEPKYSTSRIVSTIKKIN